MTENSKIPLLKNSLKLIEIETKDIAAIEQVTVRTAQYYADKNKEQFPLQRNPQGNFYFLDYHHWKINRLKREIAKLKDAADESMNSIQKEIELYKLEKIKTEHQRDQAKLLDREDTLMVMTNILSTAAKKYLTLQYDLRRDIEELVKIFIPGLESEEEITQEDRERIAKFKDALQEIMHKGFFQTAEDMSKLDVDKLLVDEDELFQDEDEAES